MKRWEIAICSIALILLLGCAKEKKASKKTELNIWFASDYAKEIPIIDMAKEFEKTHSGVKVLLTGYEWGELETKLKISTPMGLGPDIAHQHPFALGAIGIAEDITDLWESWGKGKEFLTGAMDDVIWKGKKYGMPLDINCLHIFYNKELFDKAKVEYPTNEWTFMDYREAAKKLTKDFDNDGNIDQYGTALSSSAWLMSGLVKANGGELFKMDKEGKIKANFLSNEVVEAVEFFTNLGWKYKIGSIPPTQKRQTDNPVWLFANRKVAMFVSGPWDIGRLLNEFKTNVKFGTCELPNGMNGKTDGSVLGGGGLMIVKGSKNKNLAFEFMKLAVSDKYQMRLAKEMARFPVKENLYKDSYFQGNPYLKPFINQLKTATPMKLIAYPQAADSWEKAVSGAFYGGDVNKLLKEANKIAQSAIDRQEKQ